MEEEVRRQVPQPAVQAAPVLAHGGVVDVELAPPPGREARNWLTAALQEKFHRGIPTTVRNFSDEGQNEAFLASRPPGQGVRLLLPGRVEVRAQRVDLAGTLEKGGLKDHFSKLLLPGSAIDLVSGWL